MTLPPMDRMNKVNKIALIRPDVPSDFPLGRMKATLPLGLLVIAGCLRNAGFEVCIIDDHLEQKGEDWIVERVKEQSAQMAGISVNLATVETSAEISKALNDAGVPFFVGGPEVTANLNYVLESLSPPYAIQGEGENAVVELVHAINSGSRLEKIPGLAFWSVEKRQYCVNDRRPWMDMDDIPLLPYDLLDLDRYDRSYAEFVSDRAEVLNTSRGCPYQCTFCSNKYVWSNKYRAMSPQRMVEHVKHALSSTDATAIYFREDHFTLDAKRVRDFCHLVLEEGLQFEWGCESRVNNLDADLVALMFRAGLRSMWFGVESGADEILKKLNKGATVEMARQAAQVCRDAGVMVGFSIMLGLPGETKEDLQKTIDMVFEIKPDWVYWAAFVGLPGAELYEEIEKKPELIYQRWHNLILPHNEVMSYPEKLRLKQNLELRFNLQPHILTGHLRRMGLRRFVEKSWANLWRIFKTRNG